MSKLLVAAALVSGILLGVSQDASARCRRYRYGTPTYQSYHTAPAATAAAAPAVAQGNGAGYSYRSFSYDAASAPVVYTAPARPTYQALAPSQSHFFRADRKSHGLSWYRTE